MSSSSAAAAPPFFFFFLALPAGSAAACGSCGSAGGVGGASAAAAGCGPMISASRASMSAPAAALEAFFFLPLAGASPAGSCWLTAGCSAAGASEGSAEGSAASAHHESEAAYQAVVRCMLWQPARPEDAGSGSCIHRSLGVICCMSETCMQGCQKPMSALPSAWKFSGQQLSRLYPAIWEPRPHGACAASCDTTQAASGCQNHTPSPVST